MIGPQKTGRPSRCRPSRRPRGRLRVCCFRRVRKGRRGDGERRRRGLPRQEGRGLGRPRRTHRASGGVSLRASTRARHVRGESGPHRHYRGGCGAIPRICGRCSFKTPCSSPASARSSSCIPLWRVGSGLSHRHGHQLHLRHGCLHGGGHPRIRGAHRRRHRRRRAWRGFSACSRSYWRRIITPIVAAVVVTAIGFSLLGVGAALLRRGHGRTRFRVAGQLGAGNHLACGLPCLPRARQGRRPSSCRCCLALSWAYRGGHSARQGRLLRVRFGMQLVSLPALMPVMPEFNPSAPSCPSHFMFLVSATETVGDCSALTAVALRRSPTDKELSGAVAADGLVSHACRAVFGCSPVTSFSQNVGLVAMTGVVNRRAIATGAVSAGARRGSYPR